MSHIYVYPRNSRACRIFGGKQQKSPKDTYFPTQNFSHIKMKEILSITISDTLFVIYRTH